MKPDKIIFSSLPAVFFLIGIAYLYFSPLTVDRVITLQYDITNIFLNELVRGDVSTALVAAFNYFWSNALMTIIIFLVLITVGLIIYIYYYKKNDFNVLLVSQALFLLISVILTDFSLAMFFIIMSLFLGIIWMQKTFEPRKNAFATGFSVISSRLNLFAIFLSIGIFLSIYMNMSTYGPKISEMNFDLIGGVIPNASDVKQAQIEQVNELMDGFKESLDAQYQPLSSDVKTQCRPMYTAMVTGIENYKDEAARRINEGEIAIGVEDVAETIPLFNMIVNITPLFIAFSIYAFLSILNPIMGIIGGFVYGVIRKIEPEKFD